MPAFEVFVDTSGLIAMVNRADGLHHRVLILHQELKKRKLRLVTSDAVLSEFLAGASQPALRSSAAQLVTAWRASSRTTIIRASQEEWDRAFEFYCKHNDKRWSLVDCSSMLICQDRGITKVLTSDRHFRQFGLEVLLGAQRA